MSWSPGILKRVIWSFSEEVRTAVKGFTCTAVGGRLQTSDETSEARWVPKDQVLEYIKHATLVERFKAFLTFDGNVQYLEYVTKPEYELRLARKI